MSTSCFGGCEERLDRRLALVGRYTVLQCVAVCCNVLQCVAIVLQCVATVLQFSGHKERLDRRLAFVAGTLS